MDSRLGIRLVARGVSQVRFFVFLFLPLVCSIVRQHKNEKKKRGIAIWCLGFRVRVLGFGVKGSGFEVKGV